MTALVGIVFNWNHICLVYCMVWYVHWCLVLCVQIGKRKYALIDTVWVYLHIKLKVLECWIGVWLKWKHSLNRQVNLSIVREQNGLNITTSKLFFLSFQIKTYMTSISSAYTGSWKYPPCLLKCGSTISSSSSNFSTDILYHPKNFSSYCLYSLYKVKYSLCSSLLW